jgi:hypothetical protein
MRLIATLIGTWAHPSGFRVKVEVCGSDGMVQFDSADAPSARGSATGLQPGLP